MDANPRPESLFGGWAIGESRKSIWLATARVGAGHVQAAKAIEEEFAAREMGPQIRYIDIMEWVPAWFRKVYAGGYAWLASNAPNMYGRLFRATDDVDHIDFDRREKARIWFEGQCLRRVRELFLKETPDWVIHTHFLAPHPFAKWIQQGKLSTRQAVVVTDFYPHRIWFNSAIDLYCVPTEETYAHLTAGGIHRERIAVTGIPLLAKHRLVTDLEESRREFGWPAGQKVVLLLTGSDFVVGPIKTVVPEILNAFPNVTLQVATGNNKQIRAELEGLKPSFPNLFVMGFCDKMNELIAAVDVVISKTGGITTSECLAHGAALVGFLPVPGQEEYNADLLVQLGAGLKVTKPHDVAGAIRQLLEDPDKLAAMRRLAKSLGKPMAAAHVVDAVFKRGEAAWRISPPSGVKLSEARLPI